MEILIVISKNIVKETPKIIEKKAKSRKTEEIRES